MLEGADVTLRGPGGFVRIDGGGVTIDGGAVNIQKGGAPGEGQGADPALPVVPLRADQDRAPGPRRLPLIALRGLGPPRPPRPSKGGPPKPLTPEEATVCGFICQCNADPFPHKRPSDCLTARIRALDAASGGQSRIKAEVPYDMSKKPPAPVMSRKEPERPSRGKHPKGSRAPDVVIVKDPSKPPTQDNLEEVIEVKFPGDNFRTGQEKAYQDIAGPAPFEKFDPERCGCPDRKQEQHEERKVTAEDMAEVALLTLLVIVLIVDDVAPGGQIDDAAIPAAIARILDRLAPVLRGPAPVVP